MCKTKDKVRFTFRMESDIDEYLEKKAIQWRSTKSAALTRIILEYSQDHDREIKTHE